MSTRQRIADHATAAYLAAFNATPIVERCPMHPIMRDPLAGQLRQLAARAGECDTLLRHVGRTRPPHGPPDRAEGYIVVNLRGHVRGALGVLAGIVTTLGGRPAPRDPEHPEREVCDAFDALDAAVAQLERTMRRVDDIAIMLDDGDALPNRGMLLACDDVPPDVVVAYVHSGAIASTTARALLGDDSIPRWRAAIELYAREHGLRRDEVKRRLGWIYAV